MTPMLVTHYAIALTADQIAPVRQRIATIGPGFDALPGLVVKLFLLATDTPCYALYYLWQSPDALHAFLDGPKFAALVARYGRPELTHYLTRASTLPFQPGQRIDSGPATGGCGPGALELDDLRLGGRVTLRAATHGRFEVVDVAGPQVLRAATAPGNAARRP